jgi:pimeloyl-ACP methyl ester carboxylesterase
LSIPAIAEHLGRMELPDPVVPAPALSTALGGVVDPRKARGIRHRLVVLLTVTVCAVAARARSFVAVAEWVADLPESLADTLGTSQRCPSESTIRRAVGAMDADAFDAVIGGFIQQLCTAVPVKGRRRVLAVDGKTLRGSRHSDRDGHPVVGRLAQLPAITAPTLVVWGGCDSLLAAHQAHTAVDLLPHGRLSVFPDCRHLPYIERPDRFAAVLPPLADRTARPPAKATRDTPTAGSSRASAPNRSRPTPPPSQPPSHPAGRAAQ